jgi:hypothetical protein
MNHLAYNNVRTRRVLTRNAVLCSFYSRSSQIAPRLPSACTAFYHPALSLPLWFPHSYLKNSDDPGASPSKSHRQGRIHRASGSLQTALS